MTNKLTRRSLLGAGVVGVSAAFAGVLGLGTSGRKRDQVTREIEFDGDTLSAETDNGDVTVNRTDGDAVQVRAVKTATGLAKLSAAALDVSRNDGHLRIAGKTKNVLFGSVSISLEIDVPEDVEVDTAESKNGDAIVQNVEGYVSVRSMNGDVRAYGVTGVESAETENGDVDVAVANVRSDVSIRSKNGDVSAALATDVDATVLARTTNGDVTNNGLPLESVEAGENRIRGTLGDGIHDVTVETTNGGVSLRALN